MYGFTPEDPRALYRTIFLHSHPMAFARSLSDLPGRSENLGVWDQILVRLQAHSLSYGAKRN